MGAIQVQREDFDDHSEQGPDGLYEWRYRGTVWSFSSAGVELRFRRYLDEPTIATLLSPTGWRPDVLASSLFQEACEWLREREQIAIIQIYHPPTGTYRPLAESIDAARRLGLPTDSLGSLGTV